MKVKVISRNPDEYMRETKNDIHRLKRNYDPGLHQLEGARKSYFFLFPYVHSNFIFNCSIQVNMFEH